MAASGSSHVLYMADGSDAEAVHLDDALRQLRRRGGRVPLVVAIDAPENRLGAYGFSDRAKARGIGAATPYGTIGANADAYARWLTRTVVPRVDSRYRTLATPAGRTLLGWSLGAASALDIGWQYPEVFARVGAFSPSLWLATDRSTAAAAQRTRIAQQRVADSTRAPCASLFMAVGTDEEKDDRDGDGINDALDDAHDLVDGWADGAARLDGLRQRGLRVVDASTATQHSRETGASVTLMVLAGGEHRQASWARMLPDFLQWAYGPGARAPRCAGG